MYIGLLGLYTDFMKRIIFLIVTFMSFSAKADMKFLWKETTDGASISAYCIFANSKEDVGTIYLIARPASVTKSTAITVTPFYRLSGGNAGNKNEVIDCYRRG